jgi:hypothetical protein
MLAATALALAMASPAGAATAPPQVYVGTGTGYSVAFAATGGQVLLIGLDTQLFCGYSEPTELEKPHPYRPFAAPAPMTAGPDGLTLRRREVEMSERTWSAELTVDANFSDGVLAGEFGNVGLSQIEPLRCQTGTYYPGTATVPFEAVPYVRFGESGAASVAGETPDYFARQGSLEVFAQREGDAVLIRGSVVSKCRFGGGHKSTRTPFSGVAASFKLERQGRFHDRRVLTGKPDKGTPVKETTSITGVVHDAGVDGTYFRRSVTGEGKRARECKIGPLRFHADRYVPAAAS